jgi:hypothetical protein
LDPDAAAWNIEQAAWRDLEKRGQKGDMGPMNALCDDQDQARKAARIKSMQSCWTDRSPKGIVVGGRAPSPDVLTDQDVTILTESVSMPKTVENQACILSYKKLKRQGESRATERPGRFTPPWHGAYIRFGMRRRKCSQRWILLGPCGPACHPCVGHQSAGGSPSGLDHAGLL